jgi:tetratricopeptide (TPR) repeat protein
MVAQGRDYVVGRPSPPGTAADDDAFERRWHGIALAVLQTRFYDGEIERYLERLAQRRPRATTVPVWPERADLAEAIAQEQRCRVQHVGARHDRLAATEAFAAATPTADRELAVTCVDRSRAKFERAAAHAESRAEAQVRGGWALFQLGRNAEALQMFDGVDPQDDRPLAYWLALFRGRTRDAMGATADAEADYRRALALFPDAQSATIGLALTLFRMNRDDEADAAARLPPTIPGTCIRQATRVS